MTSKINHTMHEALRLMQAGDLHAATRAIQRGLQGHDEAAYPAAERSESIAATDLEGQYRVVPDEPAESAVVPASAWSRGPDPVEGSDGHFASHRFQCDAGVLRYKLFIPTGLRAGAAAPLLLMLHGCTQSPDDFARGTRMNALAQEHGYVVAYPAQEERKNASRCWNWFRSEDQQRGKGEAAILAELTRHLVKSHGLDERRVYAAGLSAGGAMAAVLASTHPELYAAIGVHSGLPFGVARDVPSAFAAMKQGARQGCGGSRTARLEPVPAIVFHGDRDTTVDPSNGAAVIAQFAGAAMEVDDDLDVSRATVEHGSVPAGRAYTRTIYRNARDTIVAEHWTVHGAGHAWFGGDRAGSYTDPSGPDASTLMIRFFSACARATMN